MPLDSTITQSLYQLVISYPGLQLLAIFCASVLIWLIVVWYIVAFILLRQNTSPLAARMNGEENSSLALAKEGWLRKNSADTAPQAVRSFIWRHRHRLAAAASLIFGAAAVYGFNAVIGWQWFRLRPFVVLQLEPLINVSPISKSFPSDHAALAFLLAYLLATYNKAWRWPAYTAAALVALGRLAAAVHYPTDILAGAVIGLALGWVIVVVAQYNNFVK